MSRWMGSPVTTFSGGHGPSCWAFTVKNIANRPAKDISSLDSHIGQQLHRTARASEYQMNVASDATTVLVFSNRPKVREAIINAVGRRPAADVGRLHYVEVGTIDEVLAEVDAGRVDLAILDGEAQPTGGMGLSRQLKNDKAHCPPIIVSVQRRGDRWCEVWSQ